MSFVFELDISFSPALVLRCGLDLDLDHVFGICVILSLIRGLWIRLEIGLLLSLVLQLGLFFLSLFERPENGTHVPKHIILDSNPIC
jgi:hypothetical protein